MKFFYLFFALLSFYKLQAEEEGTPVVLNCNTVAQEKAVEQGHVEAKAAAENSHKKIANDYLLGPTIGVTSSFDHLGAPKYYMQYGAAFSYQFMDNVWAELFYAHSYLKHFPLVTLNSVLNSIALRVKYTVALPFDSFIMPYIGARYFFLDIPYYYDNFHAAHVRSLEEKAKRRHLFTDSLIFGATVMKRIIPGLLARADIGFDSLNLGVNVEF